VARRKAGPRHTLADPNTIITFPTGYDGSTSFPLWFAFHGGGRTNLPAAPGKIAFGADVLRLALVRLWPRPTRFRRVFFPRRR